MGYVYGKTYKEVKEKLTLARAKAKPRKIEPASDITISAWFDTWLLSQKQLKQSSKSVYSVLIDKHIKKKLGKLRLCDISKEIVQNFIYDLSAKLQPSSVRSVYTVLKLGLDCAADRNLMRMV